MNKEIPKRRNYTLHPERAQELARIALDLSEGLGATVTKQGILDNLVWLLRWDTTVQKKLSKRIKEVI